MTDDQMMDLLKDRMSGIDMATPVEKIMIRGDARRQHRRLATMAAGGLAVAGLAVGVPAYTGAAPPAPSPGGSTFVQLAAFSVVRNPDGTATLKLPKTQVVDPVALQKALADAGVPALIRIGSFCSTDEGAGGKSKIDEVLSSQRSEDGTVIIVIDPNAMPPGTKLSIGYKPETSPGTKDRVRMTLITTGAELHCRTFK